MVKYLLMTDFSENGLGSICREEKIKLLRYVGNFQKCKIP